MGKRGRGVSKEAHGDGDRVEPGVPSWGMEVGAYFLERGRGILPGFGGV
jgi:hypothetical protein